MKDVDPEVIVIQAGTNNVGGRPGGQAKVDGIVAGIEAIVESSRIRAPDAELILTANFPCSESAVVSEIEAINNRLEQLAKNHGLRFLNINERLADEDGLLLDEVSSDGLHLSEAGYEVWADALRPVLTELLGPPAAADQAPPATGTTRPPGCNWF